MQINGQSVGYATAGDDGPPVLLLHGTVMSRTAFDGVCGAMPTDASYRYVMMDLPGSGGSSLPDGPLTVEGIAATGHTLMQELGHERYHIAGFSLGAIVAAAMAGRYQQAVRSATLIAGWITTDARMRATFELWRRLIAADPKLFARYVLADGFTADAHELMASMAEGLVDLIAGSIASGYAAQVDLDMAIDISSEVGKITAPTLIIGGADDRWVDVKHSHALGRAIAGSRVEVLAAGHMMITEQPGQVAAFLQPYIASH